MEYILKTESFELSIKLKVFEDDIKYPNNTIMSIKVESNGFCANTNMDINIKDFAKFTVDLYKIYETLSGEAKIEEPYGMHMYLYFKGNGRGHISIKGYLTNCGQSLEFENNIEQTCLQEFCYNLKQIYCKYL